MWKLAAVVSGWPYLKSVFFSHRYPRANCLQKGCNCQRLKDSSTQGTTKISYPTGIRKIIISKSTFYLGDIWYMTHVSFQKASICFHPKKHILEISWEIFPTCRCKRLVGAPPFPQRPLPYHRLLGSGSRAQVVNGTWRWISLVGLGWNQRSCEISGLVGGWTPRKHPFIGDLYRNYMGFIWDLYWIYRGFIGDLYWIYMGFIGNLVWNTLVEPFPSEKICARRQIGNLHLPQKVSEWKFQKIVELPAPRFTSNLIKFTSLLGTFSSWLLLVWYTS